MGFKYGYSFDIVFGLVVVVVVLVAPGTHEVPVVVPGKAEVGHVDLALVVHAGGGARLQLDCADRDPDQAHQQDDQGQDDQELKQGEGPPSAAIRALGRGCSGRSC